MTIRFYYFRTYQICLLVNINQSYQSLRTTPSKTATKQTKGGSSLAREDVFIRCTAWRQNNELTSLATTRPISITLVILLLDRISKPRLLCEYRIPDQLSERYAIKPHSHQVPLQTVLVVTHLDRSWTQPTSTPWLQLLLLELMRMSKPRPPWWGASLSWACPKTMMIHINLTAAPLLHPHRFQTTSRAPTPALSSPAEEAAKAKK